MSAPAGTIHYYEHGRSDRGTLCGVHADHDFSGTVQEALAAALAAGFKAYPCRKCADALAELIPQSEH